MGTWGKLDTLNGCEEMMNDAGADGGDGVDDKNGDGDGVAGGGTTRQSWWRCG